MQQLKVLDEKKLEPNVLAFNSLCENGKNIIIWDFDINNENSLDKIEKALSAIQNIYKLGRILIFKTRNGYNAICLDKLEFQEVYGIKYNTAFDDRKHLDYGLENYSWRCRIGDDKKLVSGLNSVYRNNLKSNAHRKALNFYFDAKITKDYSFDNSDNIKLEGYWCWKETYHKGE